MKVTISPVTIKIGDAEAHILEVTKRQFVNGDIFYHVSCYVTYRNYMSQIFALRVKDEKQLLFQLRVEVAKFKNLILHGHDRLFVQI